MFICIKRFQDVNKKFVCFLIIVDTLISVFKDNKIIEKSPIVKVGPPVHNYEHEAGSYGDGFT